nr:MAG TPA: hypothetical protein [Caudoviricetes sp.]
MAPVTFIRRLSTVGPKVEGSFVVAGANFFRLATWIGREGDVPV